jgi:hypothetical protein
MSFGFGAADLKGVLKLSKWLWDNCFDKDGTAGNVAAVPCCDAGPAHFAFEMAN